MSPLTLGVSWKKSKNFLTIVVWKSSYGQSSKELIFSRFLFYCVFVSVGVKNARSQASAVLLRSAFALLVKGSTMDVYLASVEKIFSGYICNENEKKNLESKCWLEARVDFFNEIPLLEREKKPDKL